MEHLPSARHHIRGPQRVVSLVPHATGLLFAPGLGDRVVAATHEGDRPAAALDVPRASVGGAPS